MADSTDPDQELLRAERHEALLTGLAELPPKQRNLLILLSNDPPLSYAQISEQCGIPVGSIGPTRSRALRPVGWSPNGFGCDLRVFRFRTR